jgi:hypothetical protein
MKTLIRALALLAVLLVPAALPAQISPAWNTCKGDTLSVWNCAHYYSGTVSFASDIKGADLHETYSVIATVTAGRVHCKIKGSEVGEFEGPGMIAVEHKSTMNGGEYSIDIWCPEEEGQKTDRHREANLKVYPQQASDYATLAGKDEHESANADPANGVTGTDITTWQLKKN